jgi:hypothetical protein
MPEARQRFRRLKYCFGFFFLAELLLFTLMILAGKSRPYSGEHFLFYWFVGPLGAWLQRYFLLSDFRFLVFVVALLSQPIAVRVLDLSGGVPGRLSQPQE